jgi:hypothetical protein
VGPRRPAQLATYMPVTFRIDRSSGIVLSVAAGIVTYAELRRHIEAKARLDVVAKAELFDARDISLDLSLRELQELAGAVKEAVGPEAPGKIALVTNSAFVYGLARTYAALSRKDNPQFRIFADVQEAQAWILEHACSHRTAEANAGTGKQTQPP